MLGNGRVAVLEDGGQALADGLAAFGMGEDIEAAVADAVEELGSVTDIREMFIGFQKHLYEAREVA